VREESGTYIAAAHLGDERGGDDDGGAEHDEVVLESEEDGLRCIANRNTEEAGVSRQSKRDPGAMCAAGGGGRVQGRSNENEGRGLAWRRREREKSYAMGAGW
jgi:hypothetical protein